MLKEYQDISETKFFSFISEIRWNKADWECTPSLIKNKINIEESLKAMSNPDASVIQALDCFFSRFYPDEPKENVDDLTEKSKNSKDTEKAAFKLLEYAKFPWISHQVAKNLLKKDKYNEALKSKLERTWLLSWHWRALLPLIIHWDDSKPKEKFILQISQIRKWELLLFYKIESDNVPLRLSDLKNKELLRAPIFEESHRIFRWDVYRMFYNEFVKGQIRKDIASIKKNGSEDSPNKLAYILGRNNFYYSFDRIESDNDRYRITMSYLIDIHPEKQVEEIEIKVGSSKKPHKTISFNVLNPEDLVSIPTFSTKSIDNKPISLLLSSDKYCKALSQLTVIMNDPLAKSILLVAPPGSGKEDLARSAFLCGERKKEHSGKFISTTLAGLSADKAAKILFQVEDKNNRNIISDYTQELDKGFSPEKEDGLYFKSLSGGLFIDEIDKTTKEVKSLLLRVLESNEVTIPEKSIVVKIPKEKRPLYIFSASMSSKVIFEQPPVDFWTRISQVVEMSHPLDISNDLERKRVTKAYLWLFWNKDAKDYLKNKKLLPEHFDDNKQLVYYELQLPFYIALEIFLLSEPIIEFVTNELSDLISKKKDFLISIRIIKNLVCRIISLMVEYILYSKSENSAIEKLKKWRFENNSNRGKPEHWFQFLKKIIMEGISVTSIKSGDEKEKEIMRLKIYFIQDLQKLIRDGTASIL